MSTALQKPWMKDLSAPVIALAKKKAVEATAAWNDTVEGTLKAAKAVFEVREKIGAKGSGSFSAWAEEEFKRSRQTAGALATIGARHTELANGLANLPPSWGTLYELAKAPDAVFKRALRRVRPDMERNEVTCLVMEEGAGEEPPPRQKKKAPRGTGKPKARDMSADVQDAPTPRQAANLTIAAGAVWRVVKDFHRDAEEALAAGVLSPEAKKFMVHNYLEPSVELLNALKARIEEKVSEPTTTSS